MAVAVAVASVQAVEGGGYLGFLSSSGLRAWDNHGPIVAEPWPSQPISTASDYDL